MSTHPNAPAIAAHVKKLAYTADEVKAVLNIGETTRWRLAQRRLLVPVAGLRHIIYSAAALDRFLANEAAQ